MKKNYLSILIALTLLTPAMYAQVGIMGKRFVIKTDIINGLKRPFSTVEGEIALTRKFTISAGYTFGETSVKADQTLGSSEYWLENASKKELLMQGYSSTVVQGTISTSNIAAAGGWDSKPGKVEVSNNIWGFAFNFYNGGVLAAPYGSYTSFGFKRGKQLLKGSFNLPTVTQYSSSSNDFYIYGSSKRAFTAKEARFTSLYIAFGHQYLLFSRLTLDWQIGGALNFTTSGSDDSVFSSLIANQNGSNLFALPLNKDSQYSTATTAVIGMGLFANVKFGLLIF